MILEALFTLIGVLIKFVFSLLPNVPNLPESVTSLVTKYINLVCDNTTFLSFFADISYLRIVIPILITLFGFREAYKFIMFIYHKLPFSSE